MPLKFESGPSLEGYEDRISEGLHLIDEPLLKSTSVRIIGPVPVYSATVLLKNPILRWKELVSVGWRALVLEDAKPISLILIHPTVSNGSMSIAIRGAESAVAFYRALVAAEELGAKLNGNYYVNFITFPNIYVTAVWLKGKSSFFIPTRDGSRSRPEPKILNRQTFLKLVRTQNQRIRGQLKTR
jgi:hypothetical protein